MKGIRYIQRDRELESIERLGEIYGQYDERRGIEST